MKSIEFALALADKVSAPAKRIAKSLGGAEGALKKTEAAIAKVSGGKLGKLGGALTKNVAAGFKAAGVAALSFGAAAVAGLAAAGGAVAAYGVKHALEADKSQQALRNVIGDAKKADEALAQIKGLSNFLGADPRALEAQMTKLVGKGHSVANALQIMQGAADLGAMGHDASKLIDAFTELDVKGKLGADAIEAIAKSGVDVGKLREALGNAIGSSGDLQADIEAAFASGAIDAATLQNAALVAITKTTGKALGAVAKEKSKTLSGAMDSLASVPARIFDAANTSGALDPITKSLVKLVDALNPESATGQKVVEVLGRVSDSIGKVIDKIAGPDGENVGKFVERIADGLEIVGDVIDIVSDLVGDFIDEFLVGLDEVIGPMDEFGGGVDWIGGIVTVLSTTLRAAGRVLGWAAGLIVRLLSWIIEGIGWVVDAIPAFAEEWSKFWHVTVPDAVLDAVSWISYHFYSLLDEIDELWEDFKQFGKDIVDGLWSGLKNSWKWLISKFEGLLDLLPASAKKILGIASPSKEFRWIGQMIGLGVNEGVNDNAQKAQKSIVGIVTPPKVGASSSVPRGGAPSINVTIHVNGADSSSPQQLASDIAAAVRRELSNALNEMTYEAGVA